LLALADRRYADLVEYISMVCVERISRQPCLYTDGGNIDN